MNSAKGHRIHRSASRIRQLARSDRGQTLVEFAVASTLFLTTIFGTLEFGIAVWRYNMISNLAQEGARRASVCGKRSGLPSADCDIRNFVIARAAGMFQNSNLTVTVSPTPSTLDAGQTVSVQVSHNFTPLTGLIPLTTTLQSTAQMVISR